MGPSGVIATNSGWSGSAQVASAAAADGAFAWTSTTSHDSALVESQTGGAYTALVSGASGDSGVALAEIYDSTPPGTYTLLSPRLINLSARAQVGKGNNILVAGFVIGGSTSKTVLIRASGPALGAFGLSGTLADPQLQLFRCGSRELRPCFSPTPASPATPPLPPQRPLLGRFPGAAQQPPIRPYSSRCNPWGLVTPPRSQVRAVTAALPSSRSTRSNKAAQKVRPTRAIDRDLTSAHYAVEHIFPYQQAVSFLIGHIRKGCHDMP